MPGSGSTLAASASRNIASLRSRMAAGLAGEVAAEDVGVGVAHDVGAVLGEAAGRGRARPGSSTKAAWCRWSVSTSVPSRSKRSAAARVVMPGRGGGRGARRAGVVGGGGDAAEREEVDAGDGAVGVRGLVGGEVGEDGVGGEGEHELGEVGGAALQHADRGADAAGHGVLEQRLQLGGAGDADVEREVDAGLGEAVGPGDDRGGLEDELGDDGHLGVGLARRSRPWRAARPWRGSRRRRGRCRGCPRGGRRRAGG